VVLHNVKKEGKSLMQMINGIPFEETSWWIEEDYFREIKPDDIHQVVAFNHDSCIYQVIQDFFQIPYIN
jgi:hypothetical protein